MLPIPAFVALVLAYLAVRRFLAQGRPVLVIFLLACAVQSCLVALVHGYGVEWLRPVLPVSAVAIPPLAWIAFQDALIARLPGHKLFLHAAAPAFALFCRLFAPETLDVVVPAIFAGYGAAILWRISTFSDMPLARLEAAEMPAMIWKVLGWALIGSALSDVLIALAFMTGHDGWTGWMITASSSLALLLLGLLSGSAAASGAETDVAAPRAVPAQAFTEEDHAILKRLEGFLSREPLHLDPNLNLTRLARRLHLPEKRLSAAVNRATGSNVSRYINAWRIRHACRLIEAGSSVTDAMLGSGFNTKSNFNREFRRVTGVAPSAWRGGADAAPAVTEISRSRKSM
ncbi:helix-turn-helix domain-containing protein [Roseobacter denitrificans]|uniref:Transcriptional regulator, AraC family, putative n=1 Tax=Roseobacter denitrificans (strain ATCC 33942 / OCh 114) TaxID=375451 RepID=Q161L2_ROSDO|nr:AraC family transcriptional regulator [Roseobacter denitrificans]ABG33331.1 transcriptional regulator, AraC family, putative [Roseobacter denitrificans OCh 114]